MWSTMWGHVPLEAKFTLPSNSRWWFCGCNLLQLRRSRVCVWSCWSLFYWARILVRILWPTMWGHVPLGAKFTLPPNPRWGFCGCNLLQLRGSRAMCVWSCWSAFNATTACGHVNAPLQALAGDTSATNRLTRMITPIHAMWCGGIIRSRRELRLISDLV
jgi:hypothetical protein